MSAATFFEMSSGNPTAHILFPVTANDPQIMLLNGAYAQMGRPAVLQVGSELMAVNGRAVTIPPLTATLSSAVAAGATTLTVSGTAGLWASSALGLVNVVNIAGSTVTVTGILDETTVSVEPIPGALTAGAAITFSNHASNYVDYWTVQRGLAGSTATAQPKWAPVQRMYAAEDVTYAHDYVLRARAEVRVIYPTDAATYQRMHVRDTSRMEWSSRNTHLPTGSDLRGSYSAFTVDLALPTGAKVLIGTTQLGARGGDVKFCRTADAAGVPLALPDIWWPNVEDAAVYTGEFDLHWVVPDMFDTGTAQFGRVAGQPMQTEILAGGFFTVMCDLATWV